MTDSSSHLYQRMRDSQRLLLAKGERSWVDRPDGQDRSAAAVLNFGCGLQLTPHLMVETVDLLEALGVDFVAVAGPQWCCGRQRSGADPVAGARIVDASTRRMTEFHPQETVNFCGAWWLQLPSAAEQHEDAPFRLTHFSSFLWRVLQERAESLPWRKTLDARILIHPKSQEQAAQERGRQSAAWQADVMIALDAYVPLMLETIPGVVIVDQVEIPSQGAPCELGKSRNIFDVLSPSEMEDARRQIESQAARVGANMVVCSHHVCSREWGKLGLRDLPVKHYISVLAEALGLARTSRYHACWGMRSIDEIVAETRPAWESWGVAEGEAREIATRLFPGILQNQLT